jgi:hypothetical protein
MDNLNIYSITSIKFRSHLIKFDIEAWNAGDEEAFTILDSHEESSQLSSFAWNFNECKELIELWEQHGL